MTIRAVVLFTHVIGMLALFIGLAFEWLSVQSLRRASTSGHSSASLRLQEVLPRLYGIAFATLLVSGILLARRVGLFEFAWLRLALGLMMLMGILGRWRATLFVRAAMGLAAVYLMIGKPPLGTSLAVTGVAVAAGVTFSLLSNAATRQRSDDVS